MERPTQTSAGASLAAWVGAALSSLCCLLPLAIITLGLGSGVFMAVTMRYRWIHVWMLREDVSAFLAADGPLYVGGPVWRIELTRPRWAR